MRDSWYQAYPGKLLIEMECEQIRRLLAHIHGDHLLQIGGPVDMSIVKSSPVRHRIYLEDFSGVFPDALTNTSVNNSFVRGDIFELPIKPDSLDVVVIAHQLEFIKNPEIVLQEIYQAMAANGRLIILSLNPWSLWGLTKCWQKKTGFPWNGKFWSAASVKHCLREIGYRIVLSKTFCFRPAIHAEKWIKQLLFLEPLGQFLLPAFGGVYLIMAQKRIVGMTPIKNIWYERERDLPLRDNYIKPTASSSSR